MADFRCTVLTQCVENSIVSAVVSENVLATTSRYQEDRLAFVLRQTQPRVFVNLEREGALRPLAGAESTRRIFAV